MSHLISNRAKARKFTHFAEVDGAPPEGFQPHPKLLPLHWGLPNNGFFPVESIDVNIVDRPFDYLKGKSAPNKITISRFAKDKEEIGISEGLQYSALDGISQILDFTRKFLERLHKPGYEDWSTIITSGAGDGLNKAVDAFVDKDDVVLIEEFTFSPFLSLLANVGGIPVPVKLDVHEGSEGLNVEYLEHLLDNWKELKPGLRKPKALYTIPTGQNPTGFTQSPELRKKIYALAVKHDFVIIEDDPYGYLALSKFDDPKNPIPTVKSNDDYIKNNIVESYSSIDTTGRVIRVETFSKLFAPGLRLGFILAHKDVIAAIRNFTSITRGSSGTSQTLFQNVIHQHFGGVEGWVDWIIRLREAYSLRKNLLIHTIRESEAHKKGYLEVLDSNAGMFATVIINFPKGTPITEKIKLLNWKLLHFGVGVVLGINMAVDKEFSELNSSFLRITFGPSNNDEELTEAAKRLTLAVYEFFEKGLEF